MACRVVRPFGKYTTYVNHKYMSVLLSANRVLLIISAKVKLQLNKQVELKIAGPEWFNYLLHIE